MRLLKIPLNTDALLKKEGLGRGPDAITDHINDFYSSESGFSGMFDLVDIKMADSDAKEAGIIIYDAVLKEAERNPRAVIIGGDRFLAYSGFKAFAKKNPGSGMIVFDAHPGLQKKESFLAHDNYLRALIDDGILDKDRLIIIGARNYSEEERRFIASNKLKNYSMKEISFEGVKEVSENLMSVAREWTKAYLSIDLDVLDPAFAPGVPCPEPGGLATRELIYFIHRLRFLRNLGFADVTGTDPAKDVHEMTVKAAAKLVLELS